jgi:dienelactone hydrolase
MPRPCEDLPLNAALGMHTNTCRSSLTDVTSKRRRGVDSLRTKTRVPSASCLVGAAVLFTAGMISAAAQTRQPTAPRTVDLKSADGTPLKATYYAADQPGPGVLLFHQVNRTRKSWDDVAVRLAAAGINTLIVDLRGFGESGGTPYNELPKTQRNEEISSEGFAGDRDAAWRYLISQPGVERDVIGVGGAGLLGVGNSVQMARQHPTDVKSIALLSGETFQEGLQYFRTTPHLPGLFVVDDKDEYPPTVEAMELAYISSSNPGKKFVHYSASDEAPWVWYEPNDVGKVPAGGHHGTDMFSVHPELPGIIVQWFVTTLIKTPGHAPADTVASAEILNEIRLPGGVDRARQKLLAARQKDPKAQLWPEVTVSIIAQDHLRAGEAKLAIEMFELNLLAYPDSADAEGSLADGYLADDQKDSARQHAQRALSLLDTPGLPASSWTNTPEYRGEIRRDAEKVLQTLDGKTAN